LANEKILIVEDQRAVAGALKLRLRGLGYDVSGIARDGFEALEQVTALTPDLILMDVRLGEGMDGIEAAHRLREHHPDLPLIYISAHVDAQLLERARATRPAGFINKPFTTKDLLTAIDLALNRAAPMISPENAGAAPQDEREQEGVITADNEGRVGFANMAAEYLTGIPRKQWVGRPLADVLATLHELPMEAAADAVMRVMNTGQEEALVRARGGRSGAHEACTDTLTPLRDARGQTYGLALRLMAARPRRAPERSGLDRALLKALDAAPYGVLVLDADRRLRHGNRSARDMLTRHRGLELRNEILGLTDKAQDQHFRELVDLALERSRVGEDKASGVLLVRSATVSGNLELMIAPVPSPAEGDQTAMVLVYAFDSGAQRQISFDVLTSLYGLTHTEAKLVQFMTNGMTLDDAADELQISVNTARTHLKHIFHKTGINRQTELIHRIESGPAPLLVQIEAPEPGGKR
jgi:DNA-binding NarL/FixJ family response regulator